MKIFTRLNKSEKIIINFIIENNNNPTYFSFLYNREIKQLLKKQIIEKVDLHNDNYYILTDSYANRFIS